MKRPRKKLIEEALDRMIPELTKAAEQVPVGASGLLALDWMNGRRTPDANQALKGVIAGVNLGSDAPIIFRALVEATCFGARKIVERFQSEGVPIKGIIGLGGVAKKSPFIMQTMADVLNMPIKIARSEQTVALGAAMFAATASGVHKTIFDAMNTMGQGFDAEYQPNAEHAAQYNDVYAAYEHLGTIMEEFYSKD